MTDEPETKIPPHLEAFLDRLSEALPPGETLTNQEVVYCLAVFISSVLEAMADQPGLEGQVTVPMLVAEFMARLAEASGGALVSVHRIDLDEGADEDEPTPTRH